MRGCIVAALLLMLPAAAETSKFLDLSVDSAPRKFYVIFAARGGSATGHAFVLWGVEDGVRRHSTIRAFGLYPENDKDNCRSTYRRVAGTVVDESTNHGVSLITEQLIMRVDETDFRRTLQLARSWECKHEFALLSSDCVEFMRAVGAALGLEMPYRFVTRWTPQAYVRALLASVSSGTAELPLAMYQGSLMLNKPVGHGVIVFGDGSRIEGAFRGADHFAGRGRLMLPGNRRYEGGIVDGLPQGRGTIARIEFIDETESTEPLITARFDRGQIENVIRDYVRARPRHAKPAR